MSIEIAIMSQQEDANCRLITAFSLSFPMLLLYFYIFPLCFFIDFFQISNFVCDFVHPK